MLLSMTGYGNSQGKADGAEYDVEVRAVNNRYFKAAIKLPELWSAIEGDVEKLIRRRLVRGSVTVTVRMRLTGEQAVYAVDTAALLRYMEQLRELEVEANPILRVDLAGLLQLPGVCQAPAAEELCDRTRDALMTLIGDAVAAAAEMRQAEGEALADDLLANCLVIEERLSAVAKRAPAVVGEYHDRLTARVAELIGSAELGLHPEMLAREVAVFAERSDIAEEIQRLTGHIAQFRQEVAGTPGSGRKLDFIAQEMLREANTIGSKANDLEIARAVVEIKTAIDRIKEQVQNVQ